MNNRLMCHAVAGYPTKAKCIQLLLGMQAAGVAAIEIQIPFSDPSADGPAIMAANDKAIQIGISTQQCFDLIQAARTQGLSLPIYIMSYANKAYRFGFEQFCQAAAECQIAGFIIPDLPIDTTEHQELSKFCSHYGIRLIPVISPGISLARLDEYLNHAPDLIYITSTRGITGNTLSIQKQLVSTIKHVRSRSSCTIALGFGISTPQNVYQALEVADIAVIGSAIVRSIESDGITNALKLIHTLVAN